MEVSSAEIEKVGFEPCVVEEDGGERDRGARVPFKIILLKCLGTIKQDMSGWQLDA